jgi:hypothetical protein
MCLRWNSECMAETLTRSIICQCIMTQNFSALSEVTCRKSETRQLAEGATKNPNGLFLITVLWVQSMSSSYYWNIIFVNISNLLSTAVVLVLQKQQTLFLFYILQTFSLTAIRHEVMFVKSSSGHIHRALTNIPNNMPVYKRTNSFI